MEQKQLPSQLKDYFGNESTQVKNYEAYRPKYPQSIIDFIKQSAYNSDKKSYLDIACGTGQLLFQVHDIFEHSIGTDISEKQLSVVEEKIKESNLQNSIHAIKADCHELSKILKEQNLPTKFDLITVGQALHWFDVHPFLKMVGKDLLKPDGTFIILSYVFKGFDYCFDDQEYHERAKKYIDIFDRQKTVSLYKFDYYEVYNGYPSYKFDEIYNEVKKIDEHVSTPATIDQLINFVKTFSAYNTYVEINSQKEDYIDPAEELRSSIQKDLQEYYTKNTHLTMPQQPLRINNQFFLRLLRKLI